MDSEIMSSDLKRDTVKKHLSMNLAPEALETVKKRIQSGKVESKSRLDDIDMISAQLQGVIEEESENGELIEESMQSVMQLRPPKLDISLSAVKQAEPKTPGVNKSKACLHGSKLKSREGSIGSKSR
jgi:hypothetical protein